MTAKFNAPDKKVLEKLKNLVGEGGWKLGAEPSKHFDDPIIKACAAEKLAVIPISGGSGLVAGQLSINSDNAIVLSLEKMNKIRSISADDGVMVVEAGCILENIHKAALQHDLMFPLSMASKGSCCIGGNLATNAGGIQVVRHGNARDLCLGIEAVLPCGSVYSELNPLRKNNTGYDLRNLLIGSEGTLGIITAATLIIKPVDAETVTALCAIESPAHALALYKELRKQLGESISTLELMSGFGLDLVTKHFTSLCKPFEINHEWTLLIEASGHEGIANQFADALANCMEHGKVIDAVIAQSEAQRTDLWNLRENTPESNRIGGAFCSSDTSVPISEVGVFIKRTNELVFNIHADVRINSYGHIGDGNIHHNVLPPAGVSKDNFLAENPSIVEDVRMAINEATVQFNGSISAEHGIGRLKTRDLELYANKTKLSAIKTIKAALDPHGIMNPGALLS